MAGCSRALGRALAVARPLLGSVYPAERLERPSEGGTMMAPRTSAGARFRMAVAEERPLQVVGAVNAYAALLARAAGFKALYVSGGGVAASSCGLPDLGITTAEDVLVD